MTWSADSITITADGSPLTWTADGYLPSAIVFVALVLPLIRADIVLSHSTPVVLSSVFDIRLTHDEAFSLKDEQVLVIEAS